MGNATRDAAVSLVETENGRGLLKLYATGEFPQTEIVLRRGGEFLFSQRVSLSPQSCWQQEIPLSGTLAGCQVEARFQGRTLVSLEIQEPRLEPVPDPAEPLPEPEKLATTEELYLAAIHLEQYRHATRDPQQYYLEGLRRDPTDIRLNNGYGLLLYRRGQARESLSYFRTALAKQTWKNPNPYTGECFFNLGLALLAAGREKEAFDAFYKSTWSAETQSSGFYWLACLAARRGNFEEALDFAEQSLVRNWHNQKGRVLKAALLRLLGRDRRAWLQESLKIDPLDLGSRYELGRDQGSLQEWKALMRQEAHNYLTVSLTYREAGLREDSLDILDNCPEKSPLVFYCKGDLLLKLGKAGEAAAAFRQGENACPDYCFPTQLEELEILEEAIRVLGTAPMAHYYLGCLLYDKKRCQEAAGHWETAVQQRPDLAMAWRNLAIYRYNKEQNSSGAKEAMESALALEPDHPRFLLEYDQLSARLGISAKQRLAVLESHPGLVEQRDDLTLRQIMLWNREGRYQEALDSLLSRRFHPWEGGEGKVSAQYRRALIHLAYQILEKDSPAKAVELLEQSLTYPENLGEGKLPNVPNNQAHYYLGKAWQMLGNFSKANSYFRLAASGPQEPEVVRYYNDQPSDFLYYQGLAYRALRQEEQAMGCFHRLCAFGERHLFDKAEIDFFAVSLPEIEMFQEDLRSRNRGIAAICGP